MSSEHSNTSNDALSLARQITVAFDVDVPGYEDGNLDIGSVRTFLVEHLIRLLSRNPERLMQILYRIDVNEAKVSELFRTAIAPDIPEALADMIIERQLQKAHTRGNR